MEVILKDTDILQSGAFVLNDGSVPSADPLHFNHVFYTHTRNKALKQQILKLIEESQEVLKICSFIITDEEIFNAVLAKAIAGKVAIFILTQLDLKKLTTLAIHADYLTDGEIREDNNLTHRSYLMNLHKKGVHVRAADSIHAKFIVADRKTGFIMSANLTGFSLNLNMESGVYMDEASSRELDKLFDVIFQTSTQYRSFLDSPVENKMYVVQSLNQVAEAYLPDPAASNLRYTFEHVAKNLYRELIAIINDAAEFLYISSYIMVDLQELDELIKALQTAHSRGVRIQIFCRGMNKRSDHLEGSTILSSGGCQIFADLYNHSKGIISEKKGMIFTADLDGRHGLLSGFEIGYILNEAQRVECLHLHQELIRSAFYLFRDQPTILDFFIAEDRTAAFKNISTRKFPGDIQIIIPYALDVDLSSLTKAPLYFASGPQGTFLASGKSGFTCNIQGDTIKLLGKTMIPEFAIQYPLKFNNLKIHRG